MTYAWNSIVHAKYGAIPSRLRVSQNSRQYDLYRVFFNKYQVRMVQDMSEAQDDNFKKVKTNKYLLFVIFQSLIFKTVVQSNYFLIVV